MKAFLSEIHFFLKQAQIKPQLRYLFSFSIQARSTEKFPDRHCLNNNTFLHLLVEAVLGDLCKKIWL